MYRYWANVVRVVDGDTIDLDVDLGFGVSFRIRVRLHGVDTPEKFGVKSGSPEWEKGVAASAFVKSWLEQRNNRVVIQSHDHKKIDQGKYGRWVVEIYEDKEAAETLNGLLIKAGHAKEVNY